MTFSLGDDGTMDTVVTCDMCGQDERYTWDGECGHENGEHLTRGACYDAFVVWALEDAAEIHTCEERRANMAHTPGPACAYLGCHNRSSGPYSCSMHNARRATDWAEALDLIETLTRDLVALWGCYDAAVRVFGSPDDAPQITTAREFVARFRGASALLKQVDGEKNDSDT